mmetsp:Transcript_803/g.1546  ORF Transcript_803/g.1546 Transcript_803/m.1546 type:complete len:768 (-) Transcript_803:236-2539(-)|eukprot:CAMPEP_0175138468 /NCGR_PEP_ID=MMETSP0087-20121206/10368_1 /TAXON_ID=136419 /ORGANISM="Unknown Unknown, Strain D1" /LENGTH=767 /DNA_ID=CAMNT_0016421379 /DNA_START=36 /DNA_END=2339 /DNA_ORIENTATION=+
MPKTAPRPPNGLEFPVDDKGNRSSTGVNQGCFAAAVEPVDSALAEKVRKQRGWRFGYIRHLNSQVELSAKSEENALSVAKAGLNFLHNKFEFIRDGKSMPLAQAMSTLNAESFDTATIHGTKSLPAEPTYEVPYHGKVLSGNSLRAQVETWVRNGVIEFSCGASLMRVAETGEWLDLSDKYFVLLGATSAMGPLPLLLSLGANIIAIDIPRPFIWEKLINMTLESCGSITFPMAKSARADFADEAKLQKLMKQDFGKQTPENQDFLKETYKKFAGCDLLTQTPEIRNWLSSVHKGKEILVGAYAYLDGPLFFRISMGMDAIIQDLTTPGSKYYRKKTAIAYLCTPTDTHVVPSTATEQARKEYRRAPAWQHLGALLFSCSKFRMPPNARRPVINEDDGSEMYICNATVADQGPNYILAKRLQHWRAITARNAGSLVSTNIAPATATVSVTSNFLFALAYKGMHYFRPLEVFQQETSNAVMGGLLLNDISNPASAANPETKLTNPLNLFTENSFHGGAWRCGFTYGSVGMLSVLAHLFTAYLVRAYLAGYNAVQGAGWCYALFLVVSHLTSEATTSLWTVAGAPVYWLTMYTMLEVVHSLIGFVRAPVATTGIQVFSRVALAAVCQLMYGGGETASKTQPGIWLTFMFFAWSLTETVRYSFYALNLFGISVKPLTFLRYTLFIVLYPMGVSGEIGCLLAAHSAGVIGGAVSSDSWLMNNVFGPLLHILPMWLVIGVCYGLGLPLLYSHMLAQRKKVLGSKGSSKAKTN